ncbi:hypothetical protein [Gemmatimonas sp.]
MASSAPPGPFERLIDTALATGTLSTIATGGALLGFGWREGEAGRVFRLAGRGLLERIGVMSAAAPLTSVALGYLHHLLVATAWGALLALLVLPLRGVVRVLAAVIAAVMYVTLAGTMLPPSLRIGYAVTSTIPGAVPIGAALALALLGGIWLHRAEQHD